MGPTLYVTAAVDAEVGSFRRHWPAGAPDPDLGPGSWAVDLGGAELRVLLTGVGYPAAAAAAGLLAGRLRPGDVVLSTGTCGALRAGLRRGQVVVLDALARLVADAGEGSHRACRLPPPPPWLHPAGAGVPVRATGLTSPRLVEDAAGRARLHAGTGADIVDMESGVIADALAEAGIPCHVARVVLDTPEEPLRVDYGPFLDPSGRLRLARLILWLTIRPWRLGDLLADRRAVREAGDALARHLSAATRAFAEGTRASAEGRNGAHPVSPASRP